MNSEDKAFSQADSAVQAAETEAPELPAASDNSTTVQAETEVDEISPSDDPTLIDEMSEEIGEEADDDDTASEEEVSLSGEVSSGDEVSLSDEELFLAALNGDMPEGQELDDFLFKPLRRGQIVQGAIASISETEILIDIGTKSEGVVTGRELDSLDQEILDSLEVGKEIYVYVLTPEDRRGHTQLSLRRAMEEQDWRDAEEYLSESRVYHSKVAAFNKGGLIVRFGKVRGFVPASQISRDRRRRSTGSTPEERWGHMIGDDITIKVIEVDRGRNRLILSELAASREQRAQRRAELLEALEVGEVRKGQIISLADFGAFVDLGGADGLIHLSELSWEHVTHPKDVLKVGDQIEVEVIHIDRDRQRIGLSRKNCLPDPWTALADTHRPGQLVRGVITKLTKFGAFARLVDYPGIEGLIHISELAERRIEHPREVVAEDDDLTLRIVRIDTENRRLGLSLKRADSEEYLDADWRDVIQRTNVDDGDSDDGDEVIPQETEVEAEGVESEILSEAEAAATLENIEPVHESDPDTQETSE